MILSFKNHQMSILKKKQTLLKSSKNLKQNHLCTSDVMNQSKEFISYRKYLPVSFYTNSEYNSTENIMYFFSSLIMIIFYAFLKMSNLLMVFLFSFKYEWGKIFLCNLLTSILKYTKYKVMH